MTRSVPWWIRRLTRRPLDLRQLLDIGDGLERNAPPPDMPRALIRLEATARQEGLLASPPSHLPVRATTGEEGLHEDASRLHPFGSPIDAVTMSQAVDRCCSAIENHTYVSVGLVNAPKIVAMRSDARLREAVSSCALVLADGQSVVWASRMLYEPLPERVAGIDLFLELLAEAAHRSYRVYFLGSRPDVLRQMIDEVKRQYPGLEIVGARDGYFLQKEEPEIAAEIRASSPDLLFVGMSSPKKELFINQWGEATGARVVHGVGGSFDVLGGVTRRAPLWYQRHGLEWLYRIRQEPVRLGRRYISTNLRFMSLVAREVLVAREAPGRSASHGARKLQVIRMVAREYPTVIRMDHETAAADREDRMLEVR
jgi:N-acetylglucosaminyldiphosphoundecaprenol N-acetyl-beta-D-mannosaminyltransferase